MQLSTHFSLEEATLSQTAARKGIDNTPSPEILANMMDAAGQMEVVRTLLGVPIIVSSWYRCPKLNSAIGGSATSAHVQGWAIDFTAPEFGVPLVVCEEIKNNGIEFDQLIHEMGTWTHISFSPQHRMQVLTAKAVNGKVVYSQGLQ